MSELSLSRFNRFEETDRIIHPSVSRRSFLKLCGVFGGAAALYGLSPLLGRGPEATPLYEAEIVPVRFNLDLGKLDSDPEVSSIYRSNILRAIDHMSPNQGKSKLEELDQDNGEPWIIYLNVPAGLLVDFNQVVGPVDKQGAYVANSNGLYGVGIGFLASALYAMSRSEQGQDMGIEVMQKVLRQTPLPGFNVETSISIDTDTEDKNLILQFPKARDLQLAFTYEPKTKKLIMDMGELGDWENYDHTRASIKELNMETSLVNKYPISPIGIRGENKLPKEFEEVAETRLVGVDVSVYQGNVNWTIAKEWVKFTYIRGWNTSKDTLFDRNYKICRSLGIPCGLYFVLLPNINNKTQIERLLTLPVNDGDLIPMLDVELPIKPSNPKNAKNIQKAKVAMTEKVLDFLIKYEDATGIRMGIYTGHWFLKDHMDKQSSLSKYPLWISQIDRKPIPVIPNPWDGHVIHQYDIAKASSMPGFKGVKVDLNRFNGSQTMLKNWLTLI